MSTFLGVQLIGGHREQSKTGSLCFPYKRSDAAGAR